MKDNMQIEQTMSSREIAELTGKDHADVLKDIRRILEEAEIDHGKFSGIYKDSMNRGQTCYNLPRRECDLIVSGYSVKYRLAIIDRWQELEQVTQVVADTLQVDKEGMIKELKQDNTIAKLQASIQASRDKALTSQLKLQALKDKLAEQSRVLRAKTTELLTQGAKVKTDMTAGKLGLPVDTITNLLKAHGSKLKPGEANNALINLGYLEPSRAEVTVRGSYYGRTIVSSKSAHTTLARWFPAEFGTLLKEIDQYYADKASGLD